MTAIPSPAFVAMHLGALLAGQDGPLTNPQKRALAYAVEVLTLERMVEPASILDDVLIGAPIRVAIGAVIVPPSNAVGTLDGPGAVSASHPGTSRQAAESVAQSAKMERLRVLASVIEDGPASASVIAQRLGLVPNQVAARAWELRKGKWLEWRQWGFADFEVAGHWDSADGYVVEPTPAGRTGRVLFLTEHGRDELVRQHGTLEVAAKLLREGRTA